MVATVSLAGQLLLALPGIGDPRFEQAVIAMCAHDPGGAIGVGIGRLAEGISLHGLLAQLGIAPGAAPDAPIHLGGPVETRRGFVLHSPDWSGEDTLDVGGRWGLTGTLDILRAGAAGTGPARWLVALGYAGWGEGQLDGEVGRHGWLAVKGDDHVTFGGEAEDRWSATLRAEGIDARLLAPETGHA